MTDTRSVRLDDLTWPEIRDAAARDVPVILPVGSTEQHGYHLPLCTDVVLPESLARDAARQIGLLVAPPVAYGYRSRPLSGGGEGFPGTISLSGRTLMALVEDVLVGLARSGFRRLVVLNWHFENSNFVYEAAWCANERAGARDQRIMVVEAAFSELSDPVMSTLFGDEFPGWDVEHAAVLETSLMQHLRPDLVLFDRAVDDEARRHPPYDVVPPPADFIPASGTLWKATRASAEKGAVAWEEIVSRVSAAIGAEFDLGPGPRLGGAASFVAADHDAAASVS
ncbi:MAG TPA: creatininase [Solirubrobacteraceae bacterium]|nr:creatininase [Solirubrobacteraceae bacterium]